MNKLSISEFLVNCLMYIVENIDRGMICRSVSSLLGVDIVLLASTLSVVFLFLSVPSPLLLGCSLQGSIIM